MENEMERDLREMEESNRAALKDNLRKEIEVEMLMVQGAVLMHRMLEEVLFGKPPAEKESRVETEDESIERQERLSAEPDPYE